jgi:PKD repeat protein/putative lipoic acid-binding regulatory protein
MILQRKFTYYSLALLFIWACGGGGSKAPTEPVEPAPVSNFTATPTSGLQPLEVVFTSTATGTIASYAWNVDADTDIEGTAATFTHTYTDAGTYGVTLTVTGPGGSNPKTVADMITVTSAAPTPTTATTQTTQEDGSTTISLTATDPNGQAVTFAITTDPTNGTATLSGTDITYTPNANFYGTDSFDYTASNGTYTSDPVTITITVEGQDDEPTTNDVSATTDEDTAVTVDLDATEIDGDNYSFSIVSQPTNGTLGSINGNQVEYTPNQDFNGTDTFTFEATDDRTFRRNVATATITINPVNDAPIANDVTASMDENKIVGRYQPVTITLDATDVEGDALTYFKQSDPTNGTLGSITNNQVVYTPTQDFNGEDTFIYKATDGNADSNGATVTITIASVNDAPVTQNVSFTTDEDTPYTESYNGYVSDVDGDDLTIIGVTNPTNGTATCDGTDCTYTPNQDFNGTDSFTYKVNDGELDSNVSTVTVTVTAVNDAPVANDMTATMDENKIAGRYQPVTIFLNATDVDGDDLTYSVVGDVSNGTLGSINGNQIIYTPSQDYNGEDTFTYKANDGNLDSNTATVSITINSVNDAPVTTDQTASTNEDTAVDITLQGSDVDGDNLTYTVVSGPSNGNASIAGSILTYADNQDWNGTETITYKANDGTVDSNTSTVTITVAAVNDAPTTSPLSTSANEDTATNITLLVGDDDGDTLTYSVVSNPSNGSLGNISEAEVTYTPSLNFNGTDTFSFKANDGTVDSNTSTVTITVAAVNDAPIASDITKTILEGSGNLTLNLQGSDVDNDSITFSIETSPQNGSLNAVGSGEYIYAASDNDFIGTDTFTYKVNDGSLNSNTATVTINIINPFKMFSLGFNDIIKSSDDNFVAINEGTFTKMDSNLDTIWSLNFTTTGGNGDCRLIEASDGSFVGACSDRTVKVSSSGSLIWNVLTTGIHSDVVETSDGGFVVSGRVNGQGLTSAKIDNSGNIIWDLLYSFTNDDGTGPQGSASIIQSSNNSLIIGEDKRLLKISDSDGSSIWYKSREDTNIDQPISDMVEVGSNGDFLAYIAESDLETNMGSLRRYNSDGNLVYVSSGLDFYQSTFGDYAQNGDKFYAAGRNSKGGGGTDSGFQFVKIDPSDGSIIWTKEIACYGYVPQPVSFRDVHAIVEDASGNINFFFNPGNNLGSGDNTNAFFQIDPDGNVLIP